MMWFLSVFLTTLAFATDPHFSRKPFEEGVLLRETGGSVSTCQLNPETKIFCEEGFWFRDAFYHWTERGPRFSLWPEPLPLSPVQAVSIGMALALRVNEIPAGFRDLGFLSAYVSDGWGFMSAIRFRTSPPPCPGGGLRDYCEFGRGRALFFTGAPARTNVEQTGRSFAEGMHGIRVLSPLREVTGVLRGAIRPAPNLKLCLFSRHLLDCIGTSF